MHGILRLSVNDSLVFKGTLLGGISRLVLPEDHGPFLSPRGEEQRRKHATRAPALKSDATMNILVLLA